MKAVNLLPADPATVEALLRGPRPRSPEPADRLRRSSASLIVVGLVGDGLVVELVDRRQAEAARRLSSRRSRRPRRARALPTDGRDAEVDRHRRLLAQRLAWDQFLGTLSKVMPEDVWLQSLQSTTARCRGNARHRSGGRNGSRHGRRDSDDHDDDQHDAGAVSARCDGEHVHDQRLHVLAAVGRTHDAAPGPRPVARPA